MTDCFIGGIWFFAIFTTISSSLPVSFELSHVRNITIAIIFYFILRSTYLNSTNTNKLLLLFSLFAGTTSILAIISFLYFKSNLTIVGLTNIYDFRFLYHPVGTSANTWGAYSLSYIGVIVLSIYRYRKERTKVIWLMAILVPVVFSLIITFSRGVYISYALLLAVLIISICRKRTFTLSKKILCLASCIIIQMAMILPVWQEVSQTLAMTTTVSQQKSIEGRINAAQTAFNIFKKHPLTGVGPGNYSLAADLEIYNNDNQSFLSASPTIAILIAEQGIIPVILWISIIVALTIKLWRKQRTTWDILWIYVSLVAIALREISLPICFEKTGVLLVIFLFIALLQNSTTEAQMAMSTSNRTHRIFWIPLLMAGTICLYGIIRQQNERANSYFLTYLKNNDLINAEHYIGSTMQQFPYLVNRGLLYMQFYKLTEKGSYLDQAVVCFDKAIQMNNIDNRIRHYRAIANAQQGKTEQAEAELNQLVTQSPANTLYRLSLFRLQYERSEKKLAATNLVRAILLSPRLLDTQYWADIASADSIFATIITNQLNLAISKSNSSDPIIQAKYGKILLSLGDTVKAQHILEDVVTQMPGLSRPWCYLGLIYRNQGKVKTGTTYIKRALALDPGDAFITHCLSDNPTNIHSCVKMDNMAFLEEKYAIKFNHWYGCKKAPIVIF